MVHLRRFLVLYILILACTSSVNSNQEESGIENELDDERLLDEVNLDGKKPFDTASAEQVPKKTNPSSCITKCGDKECRTVEGTFKLEELNSGYNDILLIPTNAMDIEIEEVKPTKNYLSARNMDGHYYLNGNWNIALPSELTFAGATFSYHRLASSHDEPEKLTSPGPINEPLIISVIFQETNPGIRYKYSVPVSEDTPPPSITYTWTEENEFGECSVTCGEGVQVKKSRCMSNLDQSIVADFFCDHGSRPRNEERVCEMGLCEDFEGSGLDSVSKEQLLESDEVEGSGIEISNCTDADGVSIEGCGQDVPSSNSKTNCSDANGVEKEGCPQHQSETVEKESEPETQPESGPEEPAEKESEPKSQPESTPEEASEEVSNEVIPSEPPGNCTESEHGCCSDGVSKAKGADGKGCPCNELEFGCCPDGKSPASGPDREGCTCAQSAFGCCRDGETEAKGENNKGCDCEQLKYGCCPDGKTGATGPEEKGCGCEATANGCCPDGKTPARGPDNEGCPCEAMEHGCCPDRLTAATGPGNMGCPCDSLPHGCCPNTTIPATGPFFAGCSCAETPYNCCPDGTSVAYGPNFEGCPDGPRLDTMLAAEACSLPRERGTCRNYTVKWYFDMKYGGCTRFWYGGCEGNANRFNSQEECDRVCVAPEGAEACSLPKVEGPCEGSYPSFYYNRETGLCESMTYGGCLGNKNRFDTMESCQELCSQAQTSSDPCEQPVLNGPCRGSYMRWYFSKSDGRCKSFTYGGCRGNDNNFLDERTCLSKCSALTPKEVCLLPKAEGPCLGQYPRWYYDYIDSTCKEFTYTGCQGNKNRFVDRNTCEKTCNKTNVVVSTDICSLPMTPGPCRGNQLRWYYSKASGRCEQFYYGGCEGNANKFETRGDCERACIFQSVDERACSLPKQVGACEDNYYRYEERWYYDSQEKGCRRFYFSGCNGNANNFRSSEECNQQCSRQTQEARPPITDVVAATEFRIEHCKLSQDHGPCENNEIKWWYDSRDGVCKEFYYGGCEGNPNRFKTRQECETRCWNSQSICTLPQVRGPCSGNFPQWYYDTTYGECLQFKYGGCSGNANRFSSKETCENQCGDGTSPLEEPLYPQPSKSSSKDPICFLQPDAGSCKAYVPSVYYDPSENACKMFIYGGCGGNANRFGTRKECESKCIMLTKERTEDDLNEAIDSKEEVCRMTVDAGPCSETHARWFYDPTSLNCLPFVYGGCGGNKNRFKSSEVCLRFCRNVGAPQRRPDDDRDMYDRIDRNNRIPETPVIIEPLAPTRAPSQPPAPLPVTSSPSEGKCEDSPYFADCKLIIEARYCNNIMYAKFCCMSCVAAGQLDPRGQTAAMRGKRSIASAKAVSLRLRAQLKTIPLVIASQ